MDIINFRFQVALFGNFDDISPNIDIIKYFLEAYEDRGLIPSQYNEFNFDIAGGAGRNLNRLSLTSKDSSWNIRFSSERADFILTNSDIGKFEMLNKSNFVANFEDIYKKINDKYPRKVKRIGFVNQYLVSGIGINDVTNKISNTPGFYKGNLSIEFSNKIAARSIIKVPDEELMNVSSELKWLKTNMKIESQDKIFEGLLMTFDINSLAERSDYRFNFDNIKFILSEASKLEDLLRDDYINLLQ